jgi:serine/threonine protein kinase
MDPQRWQRARELFDAAVDLTPAQWDGLLAACSDDTAVQAEVRALLEADRQRALDTGHGHGHGMVARAPDLLSRLAEDDARSAAALLLRRQFGAWRIVDLIGQGGMGTVYLAERVAGGFTQRAALKLVRPGAGGDELPARLRGERQILAGLDHPNIAHLLDGGAGPEGEPFLALEYVDGVDLRAHCDAARLGLAARLRLFLTVCEAVAYAHARLVVHRDLKPGNILVTREGAVKLLDFGVAKLLDREHAAEATEVRLRRFTPEYAAPEQILGEPTTTAVDVYALGVLLFELLTGRRPYRTCGRSSGEIEHAVLHEPPSRPSSVVTRNEAARNPALAPETLAQLRDATPQQLRARLRGDLDHIVLKALRKPPGERYASVRALADDVQAYLQCRPVAARRGSTRYRITRFVQRHALATALTGLAVLALVASLGSALWQAREAQRQRDAARVEADKAHAALEFMTGLFRLADPGTAQGEKVTARELLARGAERIRTELRAQPQARAGLLHAMGEAHRGLGLYAQALPLLQEARRDGDDSPPTRLALAATLIDLGKFEDAQRELDALRAEVSRHEAPDELLLAEIDTVLATALQQLNRLDAAQAAIGRALATRRARLGEDARQTQESVLRHASLLVLQDRDEEARAATAAVVDALRDAQPRDDAFFSRVLSAHAMTVSNTGPLAEAARLRREELALNERIFGPEHLRTLSTLNDLAAVLFTQRDYAAAEPLFAQVLAARRSQLGPDHPSVATAANNLANALLSMHRYEQARPFAEDALRIRLAVHGERHHTTAASLRAVGGLALERGETAQALALLERALAAYEASLGPDNPILLGTINDLVRARLAAGVDDPDCALPRRAQALSRAEATPTAPESNYQFALLGACRAAHGERAGALAMREALAVLRAGFGPDDRRTRIVAALQPR